MSTDNFGLIVKEIAEKQGISQGELASRSGMSRVQINRIMSGNYANVRTDTRQSIATALGMNVDDFAGIDAIQVYSRKMREKHLVKSLAGLGFAELQKQPLNTFYVPPAGVIGPFEKCGKTMFFSPDMPESRSAEEPAPAVQQILANKRVVVLGVPGAGKTTLLQFLATESASGQLGIAEIPIVVRLPEFALALQEQPSLTVVDWVISQAETMECPQLLDPLLDRLKNHPGTVLAMFDGLDEVPGSESPESNGFRVENIRGQVIDAISKFVSEFRSQRFVVTSRLNGFDESPWSELEFRRLTLQEYGDDQIRDAVSKWSTILSNSKHEPAVKIASELTDAIFENPRVKQLAGNPLILTILILMCKARGYALPRRRVDLYEKVAEVFLDSWETSKRKEHGFREIGNIDLEPRELKWLIAELALAMQKAGLFTAHRWWVIDHLRNTLCNRLGFDSLTARKQADPILRFISARAGLFDEQMPSVFAFTHRTMQEYFAAFGLIEDSKVDPVHMGLTKLVRPYLYHPEWAEVVRLIAAQVSPSQAEEFLKIIVDDPDPTGRFLRRGELLAIQCLGDGATVSDRQFVKRMLQSLENLGQSPWLGITMQVFRNVRSLRGTRYEQLAEETTNRILDIAKEKLSEDEWRSLTFSARCANRIVITVPKDETESPVLSHRFTAGDFAKEEYFPNFSLFAKDQARWQTLAGKWLDNNDVPDEAKEAIVWFMQYAFDGDAELRKKIRIRLKHTLTSNQADRVRVAAARALGTIPPGGIDVSSILAKRFTDKNESITVRSACALGLERSAAKDASIRDLLLNYVRDENVEDSLRRAAAYALEEAAGECTVVASSLYEIAIKNPPSSLSLACISSLSSVCEAYFHSFVEWLNESSMRSVSAGRVLSDAYTAGELDWNDDMARRIEEQLITSGAGPSAEHRPCFHILAAISNLCDARERRSGMRVEDVIAAALRPYAKDIRYAFIFGSVARNDQDRDSDIDLMLIGNITLKSITPAIKQMESTLGREVNPTPYTMESFVNKRLEQSPFISDVMAKLKIFIELQGRVPAEEEFIDDIRTMGTESLA